MKKSYIIIGVVVIVMLVAVINSNSQSKKQLEENSTNIEGTTNTENSTKENNTENKDEYIQNNQISNESEENNMYSTGKHHAEIVVKNYGTIVLELDADVAPITVENFANLGLTFHRIISGFMIQGGDPLGNGTGGSSKTIKGEFASNGVKNSISHVRGTISMARSSMPNSASSQFFIVHQDSTFLDGQYAAFGTVTSGMEVVDKICADTAVEDDNGTVAKNNQPVIEKITIID